MDSVETYLFEFDAKISKHTKVVRSWGATVEGAWQIILWRYQRANSRPEQLAFRILQTYRSQAGLSDDGASYLREAEALYEKVMAEEAEAEKRRPDFYYK